MYKHHNYHTDYRIAETIADRLRLIANVFLSPSDVLDRVESKEQLYFYYYWLGGKKIK